MKERKADSVYPQNIEFCFPEILFPPQNQMCRIMYPGLIIGLLPCKHVHLCDHTPEILVGIPSNVKAL